MAALEPALSRRRYEAGHWDGVIQEYRETALRPASLPPALHPLLARLEAALLGGDALHGETRAGGVLAGGGGGGVGEGRGGGRGSDGGAKGGGGGTSRGGGVAALPELHVLDLAATGVIAHHVDSWKFSGGLVGGLCLLSDAVMSLAPDPEHWPRGAALPPPEQREARLLLPRRCLYALTREARYCWGHAVLPGRQAAGGGVEVVKGRRVSVLVRDAAVGAAPVPPVPPRGCGPVEAGEGRE
jgi:hypothetical protein